ncbi:hypothetical protein VNO78_24079 [Psophocarpus tetragonolobus]|uniref:Uncharacterized protein n=1 Tax=Psophocarpus tetragonolobus TaxID=3891 RepID=A0AAN9S563_PSOTE
MAHSLLFVSLAGLFANGSKVAGGDVKKENATCELMEGSGYLKIHNEITRRLHELDLLNEDKGSMAKELKDQVDERSNFQMWGARKCSMKVRMMPSHHAPYALGDTHATMDETKDRDPVKKSKRTPTTKALCWADTDIERQKLGERMGLDTPVVITVNDGY